MDSICNLFILLNAGLTAAAIELANNILVCFFCHSWHTWLLSLHIIQDSCFVDGTVYIPILSSRQ